MVYSIASEDEQPTRRLAIRSVTLDLESAKYHALSVYCAHDVAGSIRATGLA